MPTCCSAASPTTTVGGSPAGLRTNRIFQPKLRIEIAVSDDRAQEVVDTIREHASTGKIGDGKIFVLPLDEAVRIRTGERGPDAV